MSSATANGDQRDDIDADRDALVDAHMDFIERCAHLTGMDYQTAEHVGALIDAALPAAVVTGGGLDALAASRIAHASPDLDGAVWFEPDVGWSALAVTSAVTDGRLDEHWINSVWWRRQAMFLEAVESLFVGTTPTPADLAERILRLRAHGDLSHPVADLLLTLLERAAEPDGSGPLHTLIGLQMGSTTRVVGAETLDPNARYPYE